MESYKGRYYHDDGPQESEETEVLPSWQPGIDRHFTECNQQISRFMKRNSQAKRKFQSGRSDSYLLSLNCGTSYFHNNGTSYTSGRMCDDCGRFIKVGTLEYFMTEGQFDIWMAIHNRRARYLQGQLAEDINSELEELMNRIDDTDRLIRMTENEAQAFMDETYALLAKYKIHHKEACIPIK